MSRTTGATGTNGTADAAVPRYGRRLGRPGRPELVAGLVMLLLAVLHLALVAPVPLRHHAGALFDEALFLQLAEHLARGDWLGPYGPLTLAKGPGFPLWLAAMHTLQWPVGLASALGWVLACALAARALRPALPGALPRAAVFALVLFTPGARGEFGLLRELIYPTLVLAVTAAGLGLALRAVLERRAAWPWALLLGLTSAALVLTREEGVLMAPLWVVAALSLLRAARRTAAVATLAVGMVTATAPLLAVAGLNHRHYGAFVIAETAARPFTAAVGALSRVRHAATLPHVPVPRETWPRLAAASPAFAELLPLLEGTVGARWFGPSLRSVAQMVEADDSMRLWLASQIDQALPAFAPGTTAGLWLQRRADDAAFRGAFERFLGGPRHAEAFFSGAMEHEIGGAFFIWALRDAAAARGHHADSDTAQRFYRRLADEVNTACARAALDCRGPRSGLDPPLTRVHRDALPAAVWMATEALLSSRHLSTARTTAGLGDPAALAAAERFVHDRLAPPHSRLPAVPGVEAQIRIWRWLLPLLAAAALVAWLAGAVPLWRHGARGPNGTSGTSGTNEAHGPSEAAPTPAARRALWLAASTVLLLVLARLAMVALIHVSAWPAAMAVRYLAPAQPLVALFVGLTLVPTLLVLRRRRADTARPSRNDETAR